MSLPLFQPNAVVVTLEGAPGRVIRVNKRNNEALVYFLMDDVPRWIDGVNELRWTDYETVAEYFMYGSIEPIGVAVSPEELMITGSHYAR